MSEVCRSQLVHEISSNTLESLLILTKVKFHNLLVVLLCRNVTMR
jgi:hypothetical protein